jgi:phage terminase large subunit-like protein
MATADGESGAEVYSAATTQQQARITLNEAQAMLRSELTQELRAALKIDVGAHAITQPGRNSVFRALSAEGHSLDGLNTHCAILDELHAHTNRLVYDVLQTSLGKRPQSLELVISTAGFDVSGIGYEVYSYCRKVLEGTVTDDSQFACIYEADTKDLYLDPTAWAKANPNLGVSVDLETLRQLAAKAQLVPSARAAFETRHLNRWVSSGNPYISLDAWDKCSDHTFDRSHYQGKPCYIGLDLAAKTDLACVAYVFPDVNSDSYLNDEATKDGRNASYQGWALSGALKTTPGNVTDFGTIEADIKAAARFHYVQEACFDPWQAQSTAQNLTAEGITTVEVRPTYANFSAAMKTLEAMVLEGRITHDGNPVTRWALSNVVIKRDGKDNIYPAKDRPENKIDPVVSILTALCRAILAGAVVSPYSANRGMVFLDL